ncbi:MAG TPA: Do family serine endopeptidase [Aestuariivirgaceae bacterium]|nr:Do family serine endopeptidase [Aestuariivirgaceae bacterium]
MKPKVVGGLLVAALLSATALTGLTATTLPFDAKAETVFNHAPAEGFADLVEKVMPAVISVEVKFANVSNMNEDGPQFRIPPGFDDLPDNSPFRRFFEQFPDFRNSPQMPRSPRNRQQLGEGSGFIISADGYAVTNHHVVKDAEEVSIKTSEGKEYKADVVGSDSKTDLALLKIKSSDRFAYVTFAEKEARVGDWVIAVGNPFGLGGTVTTGVISARGRDIGSGPYDDFLQIDAPINRGNSGGPAFNLAGEVIGVNTAIFSPSGGGSVGIGFAIPASIAKDIVSTLRDNGKVTRGWLGVQIQPVTDEIAESMGLTVTKGALVSDVTDKSPAAKAGIKTGDTVVSVNGTEVLEPKDLARRIAQIKPGKPAELIVLRDGKQTVLSVEIGVMPADAELSLAPESKPSPATLSSLGLSLETNETGDGVTIVAVEAGSSADGKGLRVGDTILQLNGKDVSSVESFKSELEDASKNGQKKVLMLVRSGDRQRFVAMGLDKPKS